MLGKWVQGQQHDDLIFDQYETVKKENSRFFKEAWLFRKEREVLEKAASLYVS